MEDLAEIRKKFHQRPETCWTEFWTTAEICKYLEEFGYDLMIGSEIIQKDLREMVPNFKTLEKWYQNAKNHGAEMKYLQRMKGGYTGVIGLLNTGKAGPTIAFRADIDALPIQESKRKIHRPARENWSSKYEGKMHSCGHDIHLTIGLGIAEYLSKNKDSLRGKFIMIFSPAEEGGKGCLSISKLPIIKEIQYIFTYHDSTFPGGGYHFIVPRIFFRCVEIYNVELSKRKSFDSLDVSKYTNEIQAGEKKTPIDIINDIVKAIHSTPPTDNDALMAACSAINNLKAIPLKPNEYSIITITQFSSGKEEELYPGVDPCKFRVVIRGATDESGINMREKAILVLNSAAKKYNVKIKIKKDVCYPAWNDNDEDLIKLAIETWKENGMGDNFVKYPFGELGTDDVVYIMKEVIKNGGKALYIGLVSDNDSGRMKNIHTNRFDIKDDLLNAGVNLVTKMIEKITRYENGLQTIK